MRLRSMTRFLLPLAGALALASALASEQAPPAKPKAAEAKPAEPKASEPKAAQAKRVAPDPLDVLRERLAQKLGTAKPADGKAPQMTRVSALAGGDLHIAVKPAAAPAPAHRSATHGGAHAAHWSYAGESGPQAWGAIKAEFGKCASGTRQSPIDIRDGIAVDLEAVQFDYRAVGFGVIDNGHTVQVNVAPGNAIQVLGRRYELVQFHFHRPSEERINGRQFDMVVHLVHKDVQGRLAVVAVLLDRGSAQPIVQTIWNNLPLEKGEEQAARVTLDPNHLLPQDRRYFTYMGSLTTPPCSEGVLWMVMQQPVPISPEQIDIFARLYPMNARPVQASAGRLIKQSN